MMVEQIQSQIQVQYPQISGRELPIIEPREMKAILYLGIRGELALPVEKHKVDIYA